MPAYGLILKHPPHIETVSSECPQDKLTEIGFNLQNDQMGKAGVLVSGHISEGIKRNATSQPVFADPQRTM